MIAMAIASVLSPAYADGMASQQQGGGMTSQQSSGGDMTSQQEEFPGMVCQGCY